jgi:hypothetical protein
MFLNTHIRKIDTLENTESAIKMDKPEKTGNIGYTRRRKIKQKHNTLCVGHQFTQTKTNKVRKGMSPPTNNRR